MTAETKRSETLGNVHLNQIKHVHLMGICGSGMSALAGLFNACGIRVTGSDRAAYPPASTLLERLNIQVMNGYGSENLDVAPDLVVVGNVVRRDFPEAVEMEKRGILYASLPECLTHYFLRDKQPIVVVGTHGKTTVSSMVAWILHETGYDPGFMIGGIHGNLDTNYRLGGGQYFVVEGDEYDTAYFDKRPKFLHYSPNICIMTSCEFDHADIYKDLEEIEEQFQKLIRGIPESGRLIACSDYPNITAMASQCPGESILYSWDNCSQWRINSWEGCHEGIALQIENNARVVARGVVPLMGQHNSLNALAAVAAACAVGIDAQSALKCLRTFTLPARRQQIVSGRGSVVIIDDFAHHPTAVRETTRGVRRRYPDRRLVAVFEPRSNTSRTSIFQELYKDSFGDSDLTIIKEPTFREKDPVDDRFSAKMLADDLQSRGMNALSFQSTDQILDFLKVNLRGNDVVLIMSNGSFDDLAQRLAGSLEAR
ncbi:MAG: UDP-N-acetylmuramate: L-alanyl-gamma-D-glutamyl-meso-diaminopimelate ligase [Thermodesulfobacteriota bacterium]|nr:UDP-N-acetylmuramate: L-alanyl-gamma-D-glutamyl-meso-diaminopimelate ligase [Thermodesulfobacteriota bacterium]